MLSHGRGFPTLRGLSGGPTSTVASVSLRLVHSVDILGPLFPGRDGGGSPRCHDASISVHAVLLDPAGVSSDSRHLRSPTVAFQICVPVGLRMLPEAQSLHLRYGLDIALSTLNSCLYLHEPKARFAVRRLVPFPGREVQPVEAPGLSWRTEISEDVQALAHELHSPKVDYLGIAVGMKSFCKQFSERQNVKIDFSDEGLTTVPRDISLCLFRVLQEALHNALKHSGVRNFNVELRGASDAVQLTVRDSGFGFDSEVAMKGSGLGLTSIKERLKLVEGSLSINSQANAGTTIQACVPLSSGSDAMRPAG